MSSPLPPTVLQVSELVTEELDLEVLDTLPELPQSESDTQAVSEESDTQLEELDTPLDTPLVLPALPQAEESSLLPPSQPSDTQAASEESEEDMPLELDTELDTELATELDMELALEESVTELASEESEEPMPPPPLHALQVSEESSIEVSDPCRNILNAR